MAYNLITVDNREDANAIARAFTNRFGINYSVHITPIDDPSNEHTGLNLIDRYTLTAEYVDGRMVGTSARKRETIPYVFAEFAYAFNLGLNEGRKGV
jgi:hypothetical protein